MGTSCDTAKRSGVALLRAPLGSPAFPSWAKDTAVIITADHGEGFGEHGIVGHGREIWNPLVRIPLIVYVPGADPKRVVPNRSSVDLAPTDLRALDMFFELAKNNKWIERYPTAESVVWDAVQPKPKK